MSAGAKDLPAGGITQAELGIWLGEHGNPVSIGSLQQQPDPGMLNTYTATNAGGLNYVVFFHDCMKARCATLLISAAVIPCTLTLDQINQWNANRRWLKATYVADQKACTGEMDVVADGVSYEYLGAMFGTWEHILMEYVRYTGTGTLVASNASLPEGRAVLPGLVLGKTTYADVLSANGQPKSDETLAQGGHVVRYPFEVLRAHESGAVVSPLVGRDSQGSLAVLTFDAAGVLQAYGAATEHGDLVRAHRTFGTDSGLSAPGAFTAIPHNACGANCM